MRKCVSTLAAGAVALTLSMAYLATASGSATLVPDAKSTVLKIAEALEKGDAAAAKKLAEDAAKAEDLGDVMNLMGMRRAAKSKGLGVGDKPGAITPDGIEAKLIGLSKGTKPVPQAQLNKEADALAQLAFRVAAIGHIARLKAPEKDQGDKKKKDWLEWSETMAKSAEDLGKAAKDKNAEAFKAAAVKLQATCNNCHGTFRD